MKQLLLASVACMAFSANARAQIPTIDTAAIGHLIEQYGEQIKAAAVQLQQLQQAAQTVQWQIQEFSALVQNPSLGAAMGLMGQTGLASSLPINPYSVQQLLSGYGGLSSKLGALSSLANGAASSNQVYQCTDQSWACQQQQAVAAGNAGAQGVGMKALQDIEAHLPVMQALRQNLLTATTPAQRENAMAALQTEQVWATNEGNQIQVASLMYNAQQSANEERQREKMSQDIDAVLSDAKAHGVTVPGA